MKKQKNALKSLHDEQFKVLKQNEMFNVFGGEPNNGKTFRPGYSRGNNGEDNDCIAEPDPIGNGGSGRPSDPRPILDHTLGLQRLDPCYVC